MIKQPISYIKIYTLRYLDRDKKYFWRNIYLNMFLMVKHSCNFRKPKLQNILEL